MTPGEHELQVHQKHHQSPILEEEIDVSNTEIGKNWIFYMKMRFLRGKIGENPQWSGKIGDF